MGSLIELSFPQVKYPSRSLLNWNETPGSSPCTRPVKLSLVPFRKYTASGIGRSVAVRRHCNVIMLAFLVIRWMLKGFSAIWGRHCGSRLRMNMIQMHVLVIVCSCITKHALKIISLHTLTHTLLYTHAYMACTHTCTRTHTRTHTHTHTHTYTHTRTHAYACVRTHTHQLSFTSLHQFT